MFGLVRSGDDKARGLLGRAGGIGADAAGGWPHRVGLGILVPLAIVCFAFRSWVSEEAIWLDLNTGEESFSLGGQAAKYMAGVYAFGALFMHFKCCWGLLGFPKLSRVGMASALYLGLGLMLASLGFAIMGE